MTKVVMRWYYTLKRLHKMNTTISPKCVKGCTEDADYLHNWWFCPAIKSFWLQILAGIKTIIDLDIPNTVECILLNYWTRPCPDPTSKDIAITLLTIAKTIITLKWRDSHPPTIKLWGKKFLEHFVLTKLEFSASLNVSSKAYNNFVATWFPILQYLNMCTFDANLDIYSFTETFLSCIYAAPSSDIRFSSVLRHVQLCYLYGYLPVFCGGELV